jgi:hypothetical protein
MSNIKTYSELIKLPTRKERLLYLMLYGKVGEKTFGNERWLNQKFYNSPEWKEFRRDIIIRDNGCDLALDGYEIMDINIKDNKTIKVPAFVHHINPITVDDVINRSHKLFDLDNVVLVTKKTHDIIHYAFKLDLADEDCFAKREPGDTTLW